MLYAENSTLSTQSTATGTTTVQGLTIVNIVTPQYGTAPAATGVGLDAELSVPLPVGGLLPGSSVSIEMDFNVAATGHFYFGYDVLTTQQAVAVAAATPAAGPGHLVGSARTK